MNADPTVPLTRKRLIDTFNGYGTPRSHRRIGPEFERALVTRDGQPVPYEGPGGIRAVLEHLYTTQKGWWNPVREDGKPIALTADDGSSITLEPGGQVELSGAPHRTLAELQAEMTANRRALVDFADAHDLQWIACGLTPVADIDTIPWMPKGRYEVMRNYLPQHGDLAVSMMKGTCSVQCNYDYRDETDCARKVRLCSGLSALTTAMFSNSPLYRGKDTGYKSYRGHIWTRTDPDRTGFPPGLRADYSHARWVDFLLDVPMMFYKRDGSWQHARGRSFRAYMKDGIDGHFPTGEDWALHQTSVFPEVRIKHTIEVRGADAVTPDLALAFCALFTGLLYCESALDEGLELVAEFERHGTHSERFAEACRGGLAGTLGGRTLADWATDLGDIGERGLKRCLSADAHMLDPLLDRIEQGRSPACDLLDAWHRDPSPANLIRAVAY